MVVRNGATGHPLTVARSRAGRFVEEGLRLVSARATEQIALRRGTRFPMWIGCGYPKSGTVWLCHLLSGYLGVPYPQNYLLPVAMRSVVHAHWDYDPRLPPTAYIRRDGRDVMVSMYFHNTRRLSLDQHPAKTAELRRSFERIFGRGFDPDDVRGNLPRFIEHEAEHPTGVHTSWAAHVRDWSGPRPNVAYVTYEDLLADTDAALARLVGDLTGEPADPELVSLAVARRDFTRVTKRAAGTEDRASFVRKGIAGDWRNVFTRAAGERFDSYSGQALVEFGYAADRDWYRDLPTS